MHRPSSLEAPKTGPGCGRILLSAFGFGAVARAEPNGQSAVILRAGKPLAVLTFLHLAPGRSASREKLVDLLWSDVEPEAGRKQLRNALSLLRSRIGPWIVDDRDRACTISADLESDVTTFAAAFADGCYSRALESYGGDFLTDFASPGAAEFEHWAEAERARFRMMAATAAESCCREALDGGRFRDARTFVDRLRVIAPHSEAPWRLSLETAARGGDSIGAVAEAIRFEEWLRTEGRDPEPASRAALRAVHDTPADASPRDAPNPTSRQLMTDLVGRETEFNAIVDAWRRARSGKSQLLVIQGAPGLGKTRLVDDLKRRFRFDRERAVVVRAFPGERVVPFSFLVTLVHALSRLPGATGVDAGVVPTLLSIDPRLSSTFNGKQESATLVDVITRRSVALNELLAAVCDETAVPILIDDYHWIDDSSRAVLASALSRVDGRRLLVVIASRSPVTLGGGEFEVTTLSLKPLSALDVENLIGSMGVLPSGERWVQSLVHRLTESSSGNPLLVLVALQQLMDGATLAIHDGRWITPNPSGIARVIERIDPIGGRLRSLPADQFRVVLACAIAGVPLPRAVLVRMGTDHAASVAALASVEQSGVLVSADDVIDLAHDAIGEKAREMADEPLRLDVQRRLATALFDETDTRSLELGIRLAIDCGAFDSAAPSLSRLVKVRTRETGQSIRSVVSTILGAAPRDTDVCDAIRTLPLLVRVKPRRIAIAATAAAIVALLGARAISYRPPPPDAILELIVRDGPLRVRHAEVPLRTENWNSSTELAVTWDAPRPDTIHRAVFGAAIAPNRDVWMDTRQDSNGVDVTLANAGGELERLTRTRADEFPGSWSPDGKQVAIETSQFGDSGHKVVAILDLATRQIRPLTGKHQWEGRPRWSPDGTRIALLPGLGEGTTELCIYRVDGSPIRCASPGMHNVYTIGWIDDDRILASNGLTMATFNASDGTYTPTGLTQTGACDMSPDGQWMWCTDSRAGALAGLQVFSTRDLQRPKRFVFSNLVTGPVRPAWRWVAGHSEYLDSLAILAPSDTIPLGAPIQLRAAGYSNLRRDVPVHALRWSSLDSTIASVDSTGTIRGMRPGTVTIEASAGGWRITRRSFVVAERPTPTLLTEDWHEPLAPRWQPFGIPLPLVIEDSLIGRSFLNNGDGTYFSGAYRVDSPFDGRGGLALDAVLRVTITREQWQYLNLGFVRLRDVADLRKSWDHRTGYFPTQYESSSCLFAYPSGEGPRAATRLPAGTDERQELPRRRGERLPDIARGVPVRVRVQIFPDGRCGLALDGVALDIAPASGPLDSLYVMTEGSSVDTRVLVGKITVRRGVPRDVDWGKTMARP